MKNILMNLSSQAPSRSVGEDFRNRRLFNSVERRHLLQEALDVASSLMASQTIPLETTENVIQQAVSLGILLETRIDAVTFEALLQALTLNPAYKIPMPLQSAPSLSSTWVC